MPLKWQYIAIILPRLEEVVKDKVASLDRSPPRGPQCPMHPPASRALALDFGRVLTLDPDKGVFEPVLRRFGLDPDSFQKAYVERRHDYDRGGLDSRAYWSFVVNRCRPDLGQLDQAIDLLIEADFLSWAQPRTVLHRLIQAALGRGVPTAIVSNMPLGVGERFVEAWPWLGRIDHRFFSADFGMIKPDENFYQHVLAQTGWKAPEVLFVDDLAANVETAARLGFSTLLFTGSAQDLDHIGSWCGLDTPPRDAP